MPEIAQWKFSWMPGAHERIVMIRIKGAADGGKDDSILGSGDRPVCPGSRDETQPEAACGWVRPRRVHSYQARPLHWPAVLFRSSHSHLAEGLLMIAATDLGAALEAVILEHEYCGELDSAVKENRVWMTCTCGAVIVRALERPRESLG
jgi:hypothetical protein